MGGPQVSGIAVIWRHHLIRLGHRSISLAGIGRNWQHSGQRPSRIFIFSRPSATSRTPSAGFYLSSRPPFNRTVRSIVLFVARCLLESMAFGMGIDGAAEQEFQKISESFGRPPPVIFAFFPFAFIPLWLLNAMSSGPHASSSQFTTSPKSP
jgi:hypothetical protein